MGWIKRFFEFFTSKFVPEAIVAAAERNELQEAVLDLLQTYFQSKGGVAQVVKHFESAGFSSRVRSWSKTGAHLPINSVEVLQLTGWKDLRKLSQQADIPVDRLRDLLAELLPTAVARALAA